VALQYAGIIILLRKVLVVIDSPAPETSWGLLAVGQKLAEVLVIVALCEAALSFICFDL
jgi:hypothetical protein